MEFDDEDEGLVRHFPRVLTDKGDGLRPVEIKFSLEMQFRDRHESEYSLQEKRQLDQDFARKMLRDKYDDFVRFYEVSVIDGREI